MLSQKGSALATSRAPRLVPHSDPPQTDLHFEGLFKGPPKRIPGGLIPFCLLDEIKHFFPARCSLGTAKPFNPGFRSGPENPVSGRPFPTPHPVTQPPYRQVQGSVTDEGGVVTTSGRGRGGTMRRRRRHPMSQALHP